VDSGVLIPIYEAPVSLSHAYLPAVPKYTGMKIQRLTAPQVKGLLLGIIVAIIVTVIGTPPGFALVVGIIFGLVAYFILNETGKGK
jgi:hypothetical protein